MGEKTCKLSINTGSASCSKEARTGSNLFKALLHNPDGLTLPHSPCGGKGTCGKCRVTLSGNVSDLSAAELSRLTAKDIERGIRLACQVTILGDVSVWLDTDRKSGFIQIDGLPCNVEINPPEKRLKVHLPKASLQNGRDDGQRLLDTLGLKDARISPDILYKLSTYLHGGEQDLWAVLSEDQIINIYPGPDCPSDYGFAVDIGSTTLVGYLANLKTGEIEATVSQLNEQRAFGADVLSRISFCMENPEGFRDLHRLVTAQLDNMLKSVLEAKNIPKEAVLSMALAGNTVMMHFLMGIRADRIASSPFTPVFTSSFLGTARELGFEFHPCCSVFLLPGISGYIGADIVAGIMACSLRDKNRTQLLVDIGTNGEMALSKNGSILCCSVAAGPAFEGARIRCGAGGVEGAVDTVTFTDGSLRIHTLWDKKPMGICGSGLVDLIAVLLRLNIIDETGHFSDFDEWHADAESLKNRMQDLNGEEVFIIAFENETSTGSPIYLCPQDIREVQLAKAAVYAGIKTLIRHQKISFDDIDVLWLAGGFGNRLKKESAITMGLLPKELSNKIMFAGNTSGTGCIMALLSGQSREESNKVREEADYLELSGLPGFNDEFIDAITFEIE